MQVTETQIDEFTRQFRVALSAADIEQQVEEKLNELAQTAQLPGFRPGKVPVTLLRKRFGASLKSEAIEKAISESSQQVISERQLRPALAPKFDVPSQPDNGDIEYMMSVEVLPDVTPPDYAQISLERLVAVPDEAEVEARLQRIAELLGEEKPLAEARPAAEGDVVIFDVLSPLDDPWPFDAQSVRAHRLKIGEKWPVAGFGEQLVGHAPGERVTVALTFGADVSRPEMAGVSKSFEVEISDVVMQVPASLDDELAKKMGLDSIDELRARFREQQAEHLKAHARMRVKRALLDRLAEMYSFNVPGGLVEREYQVLVRQFAAEAGEGGDAAAATDHDHAHEDHEHADHSHDPAHGPADHDPTTCTDPSHHHHHHDENAGLAADERKLSAEQLGECRALALRRVRLGLVLAEIGRGSNLRVTPEELGRAMVAEARKYTGQEQAVLNFLRNNTGAQEAIAAPILEDKVIDYILELAQVSERQVSIEELLRDPDERATSEGEAAPQAQAEAVTQS